MPQIKLPTFSGAYDQWIEFRDTFVALVHDNETISDVEKLHYLKLALKDDALQVIHSIKVTNDNYNIAWNLLKDRFKIKE